MAIFEFTGRNRNGELARGRREAESVTVLAKQLVDSGVTPIDINEVAESASIWGDITKALGLGQPGLVDLILFTRQMHALTKAGVPILRGLGLVAEATRNRQLSDALYLVLEDLEAGREFSSALSRHPNIFNNLYLNIIKVGEQAGKLEAALLMLYQYLDSDRLTLKKIRSALFYPATVILAIVLATVFLMAKVIPKFAGVFTNYNLELPIQTQVIISISNFFADQWLFLLFVTGCLVIAARRFVNTPPGEMVWHEYKLKLPRIGDIILRATLARFAQSLFMCNSAGLPILQGLSLTAKAIDNAFIEAKINNMRFDVEKGESLTRSALATKMFSPLVVQMMAVGEETGQVDEMMKEVAEFYESEVAYDIDNLTKIIEPVLTLVLGLMVLVLALGIFLPMWDLVKIAQR